MTEYTANIYIQIVVCEYLLFIFTTAYLVEEKKKKYVAKSIWQNAI